MAWTPADAAVVLAVMLGSLVATNALVATGYVRAMSAEAQAGARSLVLALFYGVQIATLAHLARRHGWGIAPAFGLRGQGRAAVDLLRDALLVAILLAATRIASTLWGLLARAAGWLPPDAGGLVTVFGTGGAGLMLAVGSVVIVGPIAEELAFRGVILRSAIPRWGERTAMAMSAALFAAYHLTAWTVVPLFVLGLASGWLVLSRRSLWPAIVLHALYNGLVVGAAYWLAR